MNCPYRNSISNICVHKNKDIRNTKKRFCGYKNPLKCALFNKWLEIKEKLSTPHEIALKDYPTLDLTLKNERKIYEND